MSYNCFFSLPKKLQTIFSYFSSGKNESEVMQLVEQLIFFEDTVDEEEEEGDDGEGGSTVQIK